MLKSCALAIAVLALMAQSTLAEDAACDTSAAPASLLQKVSRLDEKVALADEQPQVSGIEVRDQGSAPGPCSGTAAQGRCWFLSELGQSCAATCSKRNRGFNFVTADAEQPITPSLVGHMPSMKQEPWAALECYAPDEDRYHTANANAAKHMVNDIGDWAHPDCKLACPCSGTVNREANEDNILCSWQPAEDCAKTFMYKGGAVTGCTDLDHPTPWCSRDAAHKGSWTVCKRVCTSPEATERRVQPTQAPAPMPTQAPFTPFAPASDEDPCTRHPDVENDLIGQSVTLDEPGYKIAAAAESPINMKRFICRTIQLIECKVTDVSALMAFVPYYSGLVSHQSYANLESELEVLCHAGGKWVKPVSKRSENE